MAWDLEIVYSGLCLFYLPADVELDSDDVRKHPQALLVKTNEHHCCHEPLLCFDPRTLDDLSVDMDKLLPHHGFIVDQIGDHLAEVALTSNGIGHELRLKLSPADEDRALRYIQNTGGSSQQPSGIFEEERRRDIRWIAPLHDIDHDIKDIDPKCLQPINQVGNCPVAAKMYLTHGEVGSHRLGMLNDKYALWSFHPPRQDPDKPRIVQALADQVALKLNGLRDTVTLHVSDGKNDIYYLKFPSDLDATEPVCISISNLPPEPEIRIDEVLGHVRAVYDLVLWNGSKPGYSDRSAPKPFAGIDFLGGNGGGLFCPCATCK